MPFLLRRLQMLVLPGYSSIQQRLPLPASTLIRTPSIMHPTLGARRHILRLIRGLTADEFLGPPVHRHVYSFFPFVRHPAHILLHSFLYNVAFSDWHPHTFPLLRGHGTTAYCTTVTGIFFFSFVSWRNSVSIRHRLIIFSAFCSHSFYPVNHVLRTTISTLY